MKRKATKKEDLANKEIVEILNVLEIIITKHTLFIDNKHILDLKFLLFGIHMI